MSAPEGPNPHGEETEAPDNTWKDYEERDEARQVRVVTALESIAESLRYIELQYRRSGGHR